MLIEIIKNNIDKIISEINETTASAKRNVPLELIHELVPKLYVNSILTISQEELEYIKTLELSDQERRFIYAFSNPNVRDIFESFGFDDNQAEIIDSIQKKLLAVVEEYNKTNNLRSKLNKYKELLSTIENHNKSLISNIELIREVLTDAKVPLEEQIKIILEINQSNINFYNKPSVTVEEVKDEDDFEITNIDKDEVIKIFKKYSIDFNAMPEKLQNKLLRYGRLEKIDNILKFMENSKLDYLFTKYEVLVKTLLYSSEDKIANVIELCNQHGLYGFIAKCPTVMFPEIKERGGRGSHGLGTEIVTTGSYNKFCANLKLFKEIGFDIRGIYSSCPTIFTWSNKALRKSYNALRMYGINNSEIEFTPSVLLGFSQAKVMDMAIECNAYTYIKDNLSRLTGPFNMFRIKLNEKFIRNRDTRRIPEPFSMMVRYGCTKLVVKTALSDKKPKNPFGDNEQETFKLYDARNIREYVNPNVIDEYDAILEKTDTDVINSNAIELIKALDETYTAASKPWYNIDGVIISKIKVLRYLSAFMANNIELNDDLLLYILSKDSMLDSLEFEKLQNAIKKVKRVAL